MADPDVLQGMVWREEKVPQPIERRSPAPACPGGTDDAADLEAPLLRHEHSGGGRGGSGGDLSPPSTVAPGSWSNAREVFEEPPTRFQKSSLWDTTANLTNAILGAGMLAFPHAFAGLGVLGGVGMAGLVAFMTYASIAIMLRPTERTGRLTYAAVMEAEWGRWAGLAVRVAIVGGSAGFLVLYLIVLSDLLVGSAQWSGIIPDLWPHLPDPLPWYLGRTAMLTWATLLVAPSLMPRTLGGVAPISVVKVTCSVMCVLAPVVLAVALVAQGRLPPVQWLPSPAFYSGSLLGRVTLVLAIIPVIMTAFVCQMSVHPLVQDLRDYTPRRMRTAVAWSLFVSSGIYNAIGVAGLLVFGSQVQGDVLSNLSIDVVADMLWGNLPLAMGFVATIKVAMAISMVMSFPITIWPMREDIIEMLLHSFGASQLSPTAYYALTYLSLAAIYLLAVCIQSAYSVVALVGATTGSAMGFIFPGMLALKDPAGGARYRAFGWTLIAFGAVLTVVGIGSPG